MYISITKPRKRIRKSIFLIPLAILLAILIFLDCQLRTVLKDYAASTGETILSTAAATATANICKNNDITYDRIVKLSRNADGSVTSLEIDIQCINLLKGELSGEVNRVFNEKNKTTLSIPFGSVIGSEFTIGRGPLMHFKVNYTTTVVTNFHSRFTSAGINQVLHQIIIEIKMNGQALIPWFRTGFSTTTSVIAAETVLVGITPETFTNVVESDPDNVAEDIFNFAPD